MNTVCTFFYPAGPAQLEKVSPLLLMHPMPVVNATKAVILLGWLLVFTALSVPIVYAKGRRYEIL